MTIKELNDLKKGDLVTQTKGKHKGEPAKVDFIWDVTDSDGYREVLIFGSYLDSKIHNSSYESDFNCNYRFLKKWED